MDVDKVREGIMGWLIALLKPVVILAIESAIAEAAKDWVKKKFKRKK